ncbi:hypothetical protein U6A24_07035 [Aquimarina gracilis]|uniref:Uncharacterized protein n=1 Tax=Aquimarina gracilis TaxID=874422 RepID=A0ABU5ZT63_9FLAO|nr:hypothetical protein [Aquimarina gracilis]MEB3345205.1 hypothetical protein [Aquimarina gracilis]
MNKPFYFTIGVITAVLLTPSLAYLLTLNVSTFEGGRGFAFVYSMPIIFLGLLISWFVLHQILSKKKLYYQKSTRILTVVSLLLIIVYSGIYIHDINERKEWKRNRSGCQKKIDDTYHGIIIDTTRGNLKIRKMDTTYKEFRYYFNDKKLIQKYFYIGQKIKKNANKEKFEIVLKNGKIKRFTIPCFE